MNKARKRAVILAGRKPTSSGQILEKLGDNFANMYAFALWQAGHPGFQRSGDRSVGAVNK